MAERINVGLINLWRINNAKGGTEKVFFDMANNLCERGMDVFCWGYDLNTGEPGFYIKPTVTFINLAHSENGKKNKKNEKIALYGDKFINFFGPLYRFILNFVNVKTVARKLKKIIIKNGKGELFNSSFKEFKPDVFIAFQPEATDLLISILKVEVPVITMFHMNPAFQFEQDSNTYINSLEKSTVIQTLRPEFINQIQSKVKNSNVICIPNIVPQLDFSCNINSKVICFLGRFDKKQKRPHLLIQAFALIKDKYKDWNVYLYGENNIDPDYLNFIQNEIKRLRLGSNVFLKGPVDKPIEKLRQASIFVFPSAYEGFGLALTEAMSLGMACVGCRGCDAVDGIIRDRENGLLAGNDPDSIAESLEELISNSGLRISLGNRAKNDMQNYSPNKIWNEWANLIKQIVQKKDPNND